MTNEAPTAPEAPEASASDVDSPDPKPVPGTRDTDRLLEHEYDGIREYDNPLPGWWVYLFWLTVIASPIYYVYYHVGIGKSIHDEYNLTVSDAAAREAEMMAKQDLSEEGLASLMENKGAMSGMAQVYQANCATCHGAKAEGFTGPNLTDEYWIHGGSLIDIYETIRDGVPGKEMQSWLPKLGPGKVMMMAAYVGTKRNTNVSGGLAPQGEKWVPGKNEPKAETKADAEKKADASPSGEGN